MSGLVEGGYIFIYIQSIAICCFVSNKGRKLSFTQVIAKAFSDNCRYSFLIIYRYSTSSSFLRLGAMQNLNFYQWTFHTVTLETTGLTCILNGSFTHTICNTTQKYLENTVQWLLQIFKMLTNCIIQQRKSMSTVVTTGSWQAHNGRQQIFQTSNFQMKAPAFIIGNSETNFSCCS